MEVDMPRENNTEVQSEGDADKNDTNSTSAEAPSNETDGYEVSEKTFTHIVKNVHKLVYGSTSPSEPHMIRGLPWKILVMPRQGARDGNLSSLGFFLQCNADCESPTWTCSGTATLRVIPYRHCVY